MGGKGSVSFQEYLEAKFVVDEASLHQRTHRRFADLLSAVDSPRILDVGTGTGAMIHRLLRIPLKGNASVFGLDIESGNLQRAKMLIGTELRQMGREIAEDDLRIESSADDHLLSIEFLRGDFLSRTTQSALRKVRFHCITAHAFLDLVPLDEAIGSIAELLVPGGIFYTTINYDGVTSVLPSFGDRGFEQELLGTYNRSMDERERGGKPVGGSRTGSQVYDAIRSYDLAIEGFGASDWSVFPWEGRYAEKEAVFLRSMIETMYAEGQKHRHIDEGRLTEWRASRLELIGSGALALVVHQTDCLARKHQA